MSRESAADVQRAASEWMGRLDRGLSKEEQTDLEEWVAADTRHAGALARAQALWVHVDRTQAYRGATTALIAEPAKRRWRPDRRWAWMACIVVALSVSGIGWRRYTSTHLATAIGEIRRIPLADGSSVTLDTWSRVTVQYSKAVRLVRLEDGAALFEVLHDAVRPFVVEAGTMRVRAIGTAFVVRRNSDTQVEVTVTRGTVDVWREVAAPEPAVRLAAGKRVVATENDVAPEQTLTEPELARSVAWQDGILDLEGRTLAEAAAEFNRYNHEIVVIDDPGLAGRRVVGRFHTSDPRGFAQAAADMLGAHVRNEATRIILEPGPLK